MVLALALTGLLFLLLRSSTLGRAIVAVRMDRDAAALMGIRVERIYAVTFGIGALMAGACGSLLAVVYPVTTMMADQFLGKAFVVCVIGGLGSVPGALAGGLALGLDRKRVRTPGRTSARDDDRLLTDDHPADDTADGPPRNAGVRMRRGPDRLRRLHRADGRGPVRRRQLRRPVVHVPLHVRGAGAVMERHRRICRVSLVLDRRLLRSRRVRRRAAAEHRRCSAVLSWLAATASSRSFAAVTGTGDPADEGALLRDRLTGHRRGPAAGGIVVGLAHRRRRRPECPDSRRVVPTSSAACSSSR